MLETFKATLSPMLVMFMCMVIGFVANKTHIVPKNTATVASKLENYIFVPALIISTFMNYCTVASLKQQYKLVFYSLLALAVALCIALPLSYLFQKKDYYMRNIYRYALVFGNFSFMGNAIVPAILSVWNSDILYLYMLYTLPLNVAVYTWGIMILIPKDKKAGNSAFGNLINPVFISIIVGAALGLSGAKQYIPGFLITTIDYCKGCMAPMAMILTGFVIGGYNLKSLATNKKVYVASFLRLIILPSLFIGLLMLIKAPDIAIILTFFAFATPLGMNTVVFPAAYGGETSTGASMAVISHTLCIITIPVLFSLLMLMLGISI